MKFRKIALNMLKVILPKFIISYKHSRDRNKNLLKPITENLPYDPEINVLNHIGINYPMFDIGANTGIYSEMLKNTIGEENLYIFEPLPHLFENLRCKFKNANIYKLALSNECSSQVIRIPCIDGDYYDTRATLNNHIEPNQSGAKKITIDVSTLDQVVASLRLDRIGFMKVDVEGHELELIEGATSTLKKFKPLILIEIESRHHSFPITEIFSTLENLGYSGYYINPASLCLIEISEFDAARDQDISKLESRSFFGYLNNFFFVHFESEDEFVSKVRLFLEEEKRRV
ncbi:FkbM family methyltransferase [Verrucomicrobiaceae bacterium 5K15]|uniref:FkbM family methyltransferase n=1 Tax=Oceaniferula flava TaxID=2800421 RepID=A0AAE2SEP3_9BACT|nr:FkbM family methyltransferase [Oceaniferula flavus]MBK1856508.1 FkbM family methyltransferase [Oceaniferula flavus]MBM1137815.1 FkbM family methyltransferase [Oceaniferula flavus]